MLRIKFTCATLNLGKKPIIQGSLQIAIVKCGVETLRHAPQIIEAKARPPEIPFNLNYVPDCQATVHYSRILPVKKLRQYVKKEGELNVLSDFLCMKLRLSGLEIAN